MPKKRMDIKLLNRLYKEPLPGWVNLLRYFRNNYANYNDIAKDIKVLIDELFVERNLIRLSNAEDYQTLGKIYGDNQRITFEMLEAELKEVKAKITLAGSQFLIETKRLKKQDEINVQQKNTNIWIAVFTGLLAIIALGALIKDIYILRQSDKMTLPVPPLKLKSENNTLPCDTNHVGDRR